ncbi:hypothetical protein EW146_g8544 [Bondarzewia mesenterica]|uniref:Uncharacterized protein n=1 Tax=Bondarzewia mesenterica TaxID=1095465 RepID=A0A4S4LFE2_9AGAM|nr:hypothetical protein EW146_g8544 [Bondarzewia mesenterica]
MPSPLAYSYTPEQKAYHSFGYGAFPAKSMAPSFVPEMSPVTRDALELALEYAQTQAQAEAWALEEQQAKLLGMLASGAPGTSSRLGAGRSVTMPRLTHTPAKRNAHSVQDTMFTGTPPLSSNAAAACFGYRGPLVPASVNRTLIGERYGRFVREWGGEDASHVGHRRPRSLGGGMGNGFGYGGMN